MPRLSVLAGALALLFSGSLATLAADDDAATREKRWLELRQSVFGDRKIEASQGQVTLEAPTRAEDAALVPMDIKVADPSSVKKLSLIIDDNPSPVAAQIEFGPAGDPSILRLRTRVNTYTNVHALVETTDGKLFETEKFVKASGGCSAPVGVSDDEALKGVGEMRLKTAGDLTPGKPAQATLMIRHPNFNGMQMDQITRNYTPARFIKSIKVTYNDKSVFSLTSDISLSSNPVIAFGFKPEAKGKFDVSVDDSSGAHFEKSFDIPSSTQ